MKLLLLPLLFLLLIALPVSADMNISDDGNLTSTYYTLLGGVFSGYYNWDNARSYPLDLTGTSVVQGRNGTDWQVFDINTDFISEINFGTGFELTQCPQGTCNIGNLNETYLNDTVDNRAIADTTAQDNNITILYANASNQDVRIISNEDGIVSLWSNASNQDGRIITLESASGGVTSVAAGNGMDFSTITSTGSVVMGTPTGLTNITTNAVTTTGHTHSITPPVCTPGNFHTYIGGAWYCDAPSGSGDITAVNVEGPLLSGNTSSGDALITLKSGTLTNTYVCTYTTASGLVCNTDPSTLGGGAAQPNINWANITSGTNPVQQNITFLLTNSSAQQTHITNLWGNASLQSQILKYNINNITRLWSNATSQQTHLTNLWINASRQDALVTDLYSNASTQFIMINSINSAPFGGDCTTAGNYVSTPAGVNSVCTMIHAPTINVTSTLNLFDNDKVCYGADCDVCEYWSGTQQIKESPCTV